jgi:hypothetical protein
LKQEAPTSKRYAFKWRVCSQDSNIPYIIVGKNFVDPTTKQESEYVAVFYTKGISAENNKVY